MKRGKQKVLCLSFLLSDMVQYTSYYYDDNLIEMVVTIWLLSYRGFQKAQISAQNNTAELRESDMGMLICIIRFNEVGGFY